MKTRPCKNDDIFGHVHLEGALHDPKLTLPFKIVDTLLTIILIV